MRERWRRQNYILWCAETHRERKNTEELGLTHKEPPECDTRDLRQLMREWTLLRDLRRQLITEGLVDGDADVNTMMAAIRKHIPKELFAR